MFGIINSMTIRSYILKLFLATRILLLTIGWLGYKYIILPYGSVGSFGRLTEDYPWFLKVWAVWDSGWYLDIARSGYATTAPLFSSVQSNLGYFPLYPFLLRIVARYAFFGNYILAGIVISNIVFLIGVYYMYKLLRLDYDEIFTRRSIKYLFLIPTAFIFSGVFSESLFFCLTILCFYMARKEKWWLVGISGFLLVLTKVFGILMFLPLCMIYLSQRNYDWKKISLSAAWLMGIPAGLLSFGIYLYIHTGDFFAYSHSQVKFLGHHMAEPFSFLVIKLFGSDLDVINALSIIIPLCLLIYSFKKIPRAYWIYGVSLLLFVPATGSIFGAVRYLVLLFPLALVFANASKNPENDQLLTISLALLQGVLMIVWSLGLYIVL